MPGSNSNNSHGDDTDFARKLNNINDQMNRGENPDLELPKTTIKVVPSKFKKGGKKKTRRMKLKKSKKSRKSRKSRKSKK
jgi:hypothetical protein